MKKDIVVIGGGVVGCAVARLLSAYEVSIALLERGADVAEGASKANSGIVHAGFDAKPNTLKAKLNVRGAAMYERLSRELGVPYARPGALVVTFEESGRAILQKLLEQGVQNGVEGLELIEGEAALQLEPHISPEVNCALHAKTSGLTSPYEMVFALADHAAINGVEFHLNTEVERIVKDGERFLLTTNQGDWEVKCVVNCAGLSSAKLHNMLSDEKRTLIPRKGEYYLLDHEQPIAFTKTIFQIPTARGKGVLVSPTVHGNLLLGPTAEDVEDDFDLRTTAAALQRISEKARLTWPKQSLRTVNTTFAGIRAHEEHDDFIVGSVKGVQGAYEAVGIESPGLSAAPAIAEMLCEEIALENRLEKKAEWKPAPRRQKAFSVMTIEERATAVQENPEYGAVVCRCEQVTEAEIREAIRRPVGARNLDAVKRRVRAGMGRCQGGFCSPRVLQLLAEELHLPPTEITKNGGKSVLLVDTIADMSRKGDQQNAECEA